MMYRTNSNFAPIIIDARMIVFVIIITIIIIIMKICLKYCSCKWIASEYEN